MRETPQPGGRAFTIVELLVVIAILTILLALLCPALNRTKSAALAARELSAGQHLIAAYTLYADDNRSTLMPGYCPPEWVDPNPLPGVATLTVLDVSGQAVTGVPAQRYPWRIAPYIQHNFAGLYKDDRTLARYRERPDFQYIVSLSPSFGLNSTYLGGDADRSGFNAVAYRNFGPFYTTRIDQPRNPSRLLAFASCHGVNPDGGPLVPGYFRADPPFTRTRVWLDTPPSANPDALPGQFGNLDYRHDGKAAALHLDGHSELLDFRNLDDMTRWADGAGGPAWSIGSAP